MRQGAWGGVRGLGFREFLQLALSNTHRVKNHLQFSEYCGKQKSLLSSASPVSSSSGLDSCCVYTEYALFKLTGEHPSERKDSSLRTPALDSTNWLPCCHSHTGGCLKVIFVNKSLPEAFPHKTEK